MALAVGTNSYISNADADTYFGDHLEFTTWDGWAETVQSQALVTAARMLDRQVWQGEKHEQVPTQVMDWPRSGLTDEEDQPIDETAVPQFIKDAQCELALWLGKNPTSQTTPNSGSNIQKLKAGSAEIQFFSTRTSGTRFPSHIHELIGRYLEGSSTTVRSPFAGGTDEETSIEDYTLTEGL